MKESALELSCGPGRGLQVEGDQLLNDALNNVVLTSQHSGDLGNAPMEVWGRPGGRQEGW